jgi:hypothetical protein
MTENAAPFPQGLGAVGHIEGFNAANFTFI